MNHRAGVPGRDPELPSAQLAERAGYARLKNVSSGTTVGNFSNTGTSIVDAAASVSDAQNGTPSNGRSQFVDMVGIRHSF